MKDYKRLTKASCKYYTEKDIRLQELEDKIENGDLFSIPFIWKRKRYNTYNEYVVVYESGDGSLMGQVFCGENAEAEAKAWFKELQNAKHD